MISRKPWSRDELIVVFNLYCKLPFAKSVQTNPDVIETANLIGRTPSAVAFKLGNFGSFDPELKKRGIGGLPNVSKLDREIWDEFNSNWTELAYQSEMLIARFRSHQSEPFKDRALENPPLGSERESLVRTRINQAFFRSSVLSIYGSKCCITGLQIPALLVASHIVPWSRDEDNRTNPRNGLCLNALHDKAFDCGLFTISIDYRICLSEELRESHPQDIVTNYFLAYENRPIALPEKFTPQTDFLLFHNNEVFRR